MKMKIRELGPKQRELVSLIANNLGISQYYCFKTYCGGGDLIPEEIELGGLPKVLSFPEPQHTNGNHIPKPVKVKKKRVYGPLSEEHKAKISASTKKRDHSYKKGNTNNLKHGMEGTPTYVSWESMKQRCLNPKADNYYRYGGKGVSICSEWISSFQKFYKDMGDRPQGHTLDRINSEGKYEPSNCRWADASTQAANQSRWKKAV